MSVLILLMTLASSTLIFQMSPAEVDTYLNTLGKSGDTSFSDRVAAIAAQSLGTPYVNAPLGEGPNGMIDKDPMMDLTKVDCVTFVEQTIALAQSNSYKQAFDTLQRIRYRSDSRVFENRNHFMEADWVVNNRFCRNVTSDLKVPTRKEPRVIGRKKFFESKELKDLAASAKDEPLTFEYVPVDQAAAAEAALPSPCVILFVGKLDWLFTIHCGIYVRDAKGQGSLCHASSKAGKVISVPLPDFFKNTDRYLGFAAYKIENPNSVTVK